MPTVKPFPVPGTPTPFAPALPAAKWAMVTVLADAVVGGALARLPGAIRQLEAGLLARGLERNPSALIAVQAAEGAHRAIRDDLEATGTTSDRLAALLEVLAILLDATGIVLEHDGVCVIDPSHSHRGPLTWDVDGLLPVADLLEQEVAA